MTAGAVLVAEGLTGKIRSTASSVASLGRRRGTGKQSGGIIGNVIGIVIGVVFMFVSGLVAPAEFQDPVVTDGEVVDVVETRNSEGQRMYRGVYAYEVDGRPHEVESSTAVNSRPTIGSTVEITYEADDPANGRRTDGVEGFFASHGPTLFFGAGLLVALLSAAGLVVSVALIVFGVKLFRDGRADRASVGASGSFFSDLASLVQEVGSGNVAVENTAAGQRGAGGGSAAPQQQRPPIG